VSDPAIVAGDLAKRYGEIEAVRGRGIAAARGTDFEVAPGETFGFLGPNEAGKSAAIKILSTLAEPQTGFREGRRRHPRR